VEKDKDSSKKGGKKVVELGLPSQKEKKNKPSSPYKVGDYVTDDRFKHAMDLVREDMNNALSLGSNACSNFYFLQKFLIEKGLIDKDEWETFLVSEIDAMSKKGKGKGGEVQDIFKNKNGNK